jgi:hypothetical protein
MKKPTTNGILAGLLLVFFAGMGLTQTSLQKTQNNNQIVTVSDAPAEQEENGVAVAVTDRLPFGGNKLLPGYKFVALYGSPDIAGLGAMGEQSLDQTIVRLNALSDTYQPLSDVKVIPTLEIITTIASANLTANNDYSNELDIAKIQPWVDRAKQENMYVLLDLQSGRTDFLTQAKLYESLLKEPHVGLALDPEWRLQSPEARHLRSIGSVSAAEINQTSAWLADLVKKYDLPQKMLLIHQFKLSMITSRETLMTDREELAYVIHADGHGNLEQKIDTYKNLQVGLPLNISMGWKNFYDEDLPTPTPEQTMQQRAQPVFVSYQ